MAQYHRLVGRRTGCKVSNLEFVGKFHKVELVASRCAALPTRRKNPSQPNNQLLELVQYLTERYTELGVKTVPIPFTWRGIAQSDLLAIIPSPSRPADCACTLPVVLADHFDTAFCEDIFAKTGQRVSNPGADDNLSGTNAKHESIATYFFSAVTTLLTAAALLVNDSTPRCSDIWLLHLTGEEFPADSMGCRYFASLMLQTKQVCRRLRLRM